MASLMWGRRRLRDGFAFWPRSRSNISFEVCFLRPFFCVLQRFVSLRAETIWLARCTNMYIQSSRRKAPFLLVPWTERLSLQKFGFSQARVGAEDAREGCGRSETGVAAAGPAADGAGPNLTLLCDLVHTLVVLLKKALLAEGPCTTLLRPDAFWKIPIVPLRLGIGDLLLGDPPWRRTGVAHHDIAPFALALMAPTILRFQRSGR
mmetsp:Transcript_8395/g.31602  ORF Transcript_8395/g.31602 Transcript_8395/m.31602 type:complete len:206 (+) Transcript_8395:117-734(+)